MRFLTQLTVLVLVLAMGGFVYAERIMKDDCKTQYNEIQKEKSDAHENYIKSKTSLRTKLGKAESQSEVNAWEQQNWRITDDYNRKMKDMEQEMNNIYNDPDCWK